jgi:hypothetical protein
VADAGGLALEGGPGYRGAMDPAPEGWYRDPYDPHEDRWFSAGRPTSLVRDDHHESRDEPPPFEPPTAPEPIPEVVGDGSDLLRADEETRVAREADEEADLDQAVDPHEIAREAVDRSGEMGIGFN